MPSTKNNSTKKMITYFACCLFAFALFFSLHMGTVKVQYESADLLTIFSLASEHMSKHPLQINFNVHTITYLFLICLIMFFAFTYMYLDGIINGSGEKHSMGSARWNTDWKKYNKKYVDLSNSKQMLKKKAREVKKAEIKAKLQKGNNEKANETNDKQTKSVEESIKENLPQMKLDSKKIDKRTDQNMVLTQNIYLSMDSRKTRRNNNILVVGGSGSGKSRFMVKPNILQANANYIVTDPAGELLESTGKFLEEQGYEIKVFNLVEMAKSDRYNPFHYIRDDVGVLMMINCLIKNTNPVGQTGGDPFWEKSETALLQALVFYLVKFRPPHQRNFTSVMKLLRAAEVDENDSTKKSKLDRIFDEVQLQDPNSIALKQYLTFKMGAGKTLKSILISCSVRLTVFNMKQIENLTKEDTIDLGGMGNGKKALFVIIPAADSTYNFLVSMMYSQLFETLYFVAETTCKGKRLPRPVRFLLDEFANIGQIPEFTKKLATMRKYEISCTIILQNLAQIKSQYKDDWESIVGNCDSFLFLGGQEVSTLEYISKELGKRTIQVYSKGNSHGKSGSWSTNRSNQARDLMSPDEISRMPEDECILIIRGLYPFYDKKFEYTKHRNYKLTGDSDKHQLFVNTRDNTESVSKDEMYVEFQKKRSAKFATAMYSDKPEDKIVSDFVNINTFINSLNLEDIKQYRSKIIIIGPDEYQQMKPTAKEQKEQEIHEGKRRRKKKRKNLNTTTTINGNTNEIIDMPTAAEQMS